MIKLNSLPARILMTTLIFGLVVAGLDNFLGEFDPESLLRKTILFGGIYSIYELLIGPRFHSKEDAQ